MYGGRLPPYITLQEAYNFRLNIETKPAEDLYQSIIDKYSKKPADQLSMDEKYLLGWAHYERGHMKSDLNLMGFLGSVEDGKESYLSALRVLETKSLTENRQAKEIDLLIAECYNKLGFIERWHEYKYHESVDTFRKLNPGVCFLFELVGFNQFKFFILCGLLYLIFVAT